MFLLGSHYSVEEASRTLGDSRQAALWVRPPASIQFLEYNMGGGEHWCNHLKAQFLTCSPTLKQQETMMERLSGLSNDTVLEIQTKKAV